MSSLLLVLGIMGCSKDEPKVPVMPESPEIDFSSLPPLDKVLPGIWVSVSEDNTVLRYDFSDDGRYTSIEQNIDTPYTPLNVGGGTYIVNAGRGSFQLNPTVMGPNTSRIIRLSKWTETMLCISSSPGKETTFIRVSESHLLELGQTVLPDYNELFGTEPLTDLTVINPEVLKLDENTGKIQTIGYGVGYIVMKTDISTSYIEVVSTPILELPSFDSLFDCKSEKECQPIVESMLRNPGLISIKIYWDDTISYRWVGSIYVTFTDNVPPQAIFTLCVSKYPKIVLPNGDINVSNQEDNSDIRKKEKLRWDGLHNIIIG